MVCDGPRFEVSWPCCTVGFSGRSIFIFAGHGSLYFYEDSRVEYQVVDVCADLNG